MPSFPRRFFRAVLLSTAALLALVLAPSRACAQDAWNHPAGDEPALALPPPPVDVSGDARHDTVVLVHVDATGPVELQRQDAQGKWAAVCSSPCDLWLAEHRTYRIAGAGVRASSTFSLRGHGHRLSLAVRPSPGGWSTAGSVAAGVGGASIATGAVLTFVFAPLQGLANAFEPQRGAASESAVSSAGVVTMAVGCVLLVAGVVTLIAAPSTDVAMRDEVARREPSFPEMRVPRAATQSLFTLRF